MTVTFSSRPVKAPLQPHFRDTIPPSQRSAADFCVDDSITQYQWKSHATESMKDSLPSLTDTNERALLEASISSADHLSKISSDRASMKPQTAWNGRTQHFKGLAIIGVLLVVSCLAWNFNIGRKAALFVIRDYSIVSSAFNKITIPALCNLDVISSVYFCGSNYKGGAELSAAVEDRPAGEANALWADFQSLTEVQKALADYFVGDGPGASELAIKIAKAELATSDLIVAVRFSTLRTAEQLADSLSLFVRDAGEAGDSLQELDAKAMGAIDSIVNLNIWALKAIEEAQAPSGILSSLSVWQSKKSTQDIINDNFKEAMRIQDAILVRLITQAKISQGQLKRMKEGLQAIRDLATRENIYINAQKGELLASIWTTLGGNRQDLHRYESNLELLESLEQYTDVAKAHVAQALTNLKTMQAQMKDLREKVSQPDIAGLNLPVHVHIRTIMDGIQRMKEGRIRARERESDIRTIGA
ncbi:hypothetical protein C0993_009119 [Termitomyces sp. T159_Od127]|nr:hypothetical protein C0993_009119 [Termitomyces sp. T159_Od127]